MKDFLGHAISAAEVATISYGDAEVTQNATTRILSIAVSCTELCANRRHQAFAFINANRNDLGRCGDCFFNHSSIMALKQAFCQTAKYPYGINDSLEKKLKSALNRFFLAAGFN